MSQAHLLIEACAIERAETVLATLNNLMACYIPPMQKQWQALMQLAIMWTERDGPTVNPPTRKGFGTQVVERLIKLDLHGQVFFDWRAEGLICAVEAQI